MNWIKQKQILDKKKGYNTRYDDEFELLARWQDMSDICKFIVSKLIDEDYFSPERIQELKRILTELEDTKLEDFVKEEEIDEVF